ncbi:thioesterase family protein [Croceicoccus sp. 1NDH52]|nr:thioesterase family protein [Croceicoccus gelatinilyticus]
MDGPVSAGGPGLAGRPGGAYANDVTEQNPYPDDPQDEREHLFEFQEIAPDRFTVAPVRSGLLRLFGGAILSQCLDAARRTVPEDKIAHSLHAYYMKPGMTDAVNEIEVTRETDGRSFATRAVRMTQGDAPLMRMMASFKVDEDGSRQSMPMPDVPAPETLEPLADIFTRFAEDLSPRHGPFWLRRQQIDWRPVQPFPFRNAERLEPCRQFWFRFTGTIDGPHHVHQRWLAYASDMHIFQTGLGPMGLDWSDDRMQTSSLDHAMWFHDRFRVDEWLLYAMDSPAGGNSLAFGRGNIFRRDGTCVASVCQQGLARMLDQKREGKL